MCGEGGGGMPGKGACVAGEATTAVGGTHPTGMHSLISFYLGTVLSHSWWKIGTIYVAQNFKRTPSYYFTENIEWHIFVCAGKIWHIGWGQTGNSSDLSTKI